MRSYTVQLNEGPTNPVAPPPVTATQPGSDQPQSAAPGPASAPQGSASTAPQTKPAPQTEPAAQPAHRKPPVATSQEREHAAASQKRGHAVAAAAVVGGWHVQVGSFSSRDHADRLARQLKSKGFSASVSQSVTRGRTWYRVRVGPERNRTAALAMASRLHAAGVTAVVQQP